MAPITRRDFLKRATALGAAVAAPPPRRLLSQGRSDELVLGNDAISAAWTVADGSFRALRVRDTGAAAGPLTLAPDAFTLTLADGSVVGSSQMRVTAGPRAARVSGRPGAARSAERVAGRELAVELADPARGVTATWRAVLGDGARYVRQEVTLRAGEGDVALRDIRLLDLEAPGAAVVGAVPGSPVVAGTMFFGFEHPLAASAVEGGRVRASLARELPLRPGTAPRYSAVMGAAPPGQLRRAFLEYVERERAHPYRPFLHYNSWYDIGYFTHYDEPAALDVIEQLGRELGVRRDVVLDSFLLDDGWDDPRTLWRLHAGFPHGFAPLAHAAARYGAALGVWLSPWGGYGKPREQRLAYGKQQGFETNEGGFALSGPTYYRRFRDTCLEMIGAYGVNQFKFDGTGNVTHAIAGSAFDSDFDAMIALIGELRAERPDLYVNLTTGTYPSPFFLRYADSIWRGGEDHDFAGVGSDRQRWITYRDADTYRGIVQRGPLFPLNSLMLHGLIYARHAHNLASDPGGDFTAEVRSYFGSGTQLQEMYITPALLSAENWDVVAEVARWARHRAPVLVDTHWVGGDPGRLEVYGHAAWVDGAGILSLRNPRDTPQSIDIDVARAFELPEGAGRRYRLRSPWRSDSAADPITLTAGEPHAISLGPFQVLTLETV